MHINNLKTHLVAITAICAIITAIFFMMGGNRAPKISKELQGDRYIQIDSATWGRECDPYIDEAIKKWKPSQEPNAEPRPHRAVNNNAIVAVSNECNGKLECTLSPTSEWVGDEPLASCFKRLEVRYRCFSFDRLTTIDAGQNETKQIDCAKKPDPVSPDPKP